MSHQNRSGEKKSISLSTRLEKKYALDQMSLNETQADQGPSVTCTETGREPKRHSDLWFHDGSVILRAQNTLFRVHMSQLSRHSVCFRDMFCIPQPSGESSAMIESSSNLEHEREGEMVSNLSGCDDCPVLQLHDDADELAYFLTALYDGPTFGDNDSEDFRKVSGILRLSTKYIVDSLRAKSLAHLHIAWPLTLKEWDLREDKARAYEMETGSSHRYPSPVAVINLAREVDAPSLLPAAFYDISRYSYSQMFEPSANDEEHPHSPPPPTPSSSSLSMPDLHRLVLGKESLQHAIPALIQAMSSCQYQRQTQQHHTSTPHAASSHARKSSGGRTCVSEVACRKDFSELVDLATQHYLFDRERGCSDPLYVAEELGQLKSPEFSECKACARSLELWAAKERERMWKLVPTWFRLEPDCSAFCPVLGDA